MITNFKIFESQHNLYNKGDILKCTDFHVDVDFIVKGFYKIISFYYESEGFSDYHGTVKQGFKYDIENLKTGGEVWNVDEDILLKHSIVATDEEYNLFKNTDKYNI